MKFSKQLLALVFVAFLAHCAPLHAQDIIGNVKEEEPNKNLLLTGYGFLSFQELMLHFRNIDLGKKDWTVDRAVGPLQITYLRQFDPRWRAGAVLSYTNLLAVATLTDEDNTNPVKVAAATYEYIMLMPTLEYSWRKFKLVELYSSYSIGVRLKRKSSWQNVPSQATRSQNTRFSGHLKVFGVRVGNKAGGYLEWGIGSHGFLASGLFVSW